MNNWKLSKSKYDMCRLKYAHAGIIAKDFLVSNAAKVEVTYSFSGSGKEAFGGASKWPTVRCEIYFKVGEEEKAKEFAEELMKLSIKYITL